VAARGSLIVASAGNEGVNTDTTAHYPSSLPDAVIMAVAASTNTNQVWCGARGGRASQVRGHSAACTSQHKVQAGRGRRRGA